MSSIVCVWHGMNFQVDKDELVDNTVYSRVLFHVVVVYNLRIGHAHLAIDSSLDWCGTLAAIQGRINRLYLQKYNAIVNSRASPVGCQWPLVVETDHSVLEYYGKQSTSGQGKSSTHPNRN